MLKDIKVAALQMQVPRNKEEGEKQIAELVAVASKGGVDMVGLSEDCVARNSEVRDGYDPLIFLSKIAKENNVYLFGATATLDENGKMYNTGFVFDREGNLITTHNKIVLTPPEEEGGMTPGDKLTVFDTEFGKMALLVCKDSFHRYAAWFFDKIRKAGADIVLVPSYSLNVSPRSIDLWVDSLKALAKWFDLYIIAPGTVGTNSTDYPSFGHALIMCPNRDVLAEGSFDKVETLTATLDVKSLEDIRNTYGAKWQPKSVPEAKVE